MIRLLTMTLLALSSLAFASCKTNSKVEVGGVAGWIANGPSLGGEPVPTKPDPNNIDYKKESGPLQFQVVTDSRKHSLGRDQTRPITAEIELEPSLEVGQDDRIEQLFY